MDITFDIFYWSSIRALALVDLAQVSVLMIVIVASTADVVSVGSTQIASHGVAIRTLADVGFADTVAKMEVSIT